MGAIMKRIVVDPVRSPCIALLALVVALVSSVAACAGDDGPVEVTSIDGPSGVGVEISSRSPVTWNQLDTFPVFQTGLWIADSLVSMPYEFALDEDVTFKTAKITIPFRDELLGDFDPAQLRIHYYNEEYGLWVDAGPDQSVDTENKTVSVTVDHFSTFAILRLPDIGFEKYWEAEPGLPTDTGACTITSLDPSVVPVEIVVIPYGVSAAATFEFTALELIGTEPWQTTYLAPLPGATEVWPIEYGPQRPIPEAEIPGSAFLQAIDASFQGLSLLDAIERSIAALANRPDAGTRVVIANVHDLRTSGLTPELMPALGAAADRAAASNVRFVFNFRDPELEYNPSAWESDPLLSALRDVNRDRMGSNFFFILQFIGSTNLPVIAPPNLAGNFWDDRLPRTTSSGGDPGADSDGDGLTNCEERGGMYSTDGFYSQNPLSFDTIFVPRPRIFTSNPNLKDTDGDGVDDNVEMGPPLDLTEDPDVAAAYRFLINDGVTRVYNPISDPDNPNSDRDDLSDFEEQEAGTSGFEEDTDHDGVWDDDEITARINGLDLDPVIHDGGPAGIPGVRPDRLFVPEGFAGFQWPSGTIIYKDGFRCSEGGGQDTEDDDCRRIVNYSREIYVESGRYDALFGIVNIYCHSIGGCDPTDVEASLIESSVAAQGFFGPDGSLRESKVREELLRACYERANNGELCSLDEFQDVPLEPVRSTDDFIDLVIDVLSELRGGLRPPDDEVDSTKTRLEELCLDAKAAIPRTTQTPQAWGRQVHKEFDRLIQLDGNPRLFGETGYLSQRTVGRRGAAWPKGTTAPDAVLGPSVDMPKALFDLKTGVKGIEEVWETRVRNNLPMGFDDIPVVEIRC